MDAYMNVVRALQLLAILKNTVRAFHTEVAPFDGGREKGLDRGLGYMGVSSGLQTLGKSHQPKVLIH